MKQLNKALFIDLEGTIVKTKSGEKFPKNSDDWVILDGILPSLKRYSDRGYIICIVANQAGVGMGKVTHDAVNERITKIKREIEDYIKQYVNASFCPDLEGYDRKPNPGMAYFFARELQLDLRRSIMVGDSKNDADFAIMAGIGAFLNVIQFVDKD